MKGDHNCTRGHGSKNPRNVVIEEPLVLVLARSLGENTIEIIHISACDSFCQKVFLVRILQPTKSQIHLSHLGSWFVCTVVFRIHASAEFICDFVSIRDNFDASRVTPSAKRSMQAGVPHTVPNIEKNVFTTKFEDLDHFLHSMWQDSSILGLHLAICIRGTHCVVSSFDQPRVFYLIHSLCFLFPILPHIEKFLVGICHAIGVIICVVAYTGISGIIGTTRESGAR
mmetsp:Transcript_7855/g.19239  ORF Transcript_7855/g.19239 Transcript_7855/m.19239 type:complete len:227 (-) Transcript_7855:1896-2576(-)